LIRIDFSKFDPRPLLTDRKRGGGYQTQNHNREPGQSPLPGLHAPNEEQHGEDETGGKPANVPWIGLAEYVRLAHQIQDQKQAKQENPRETEFQSRGLPVKNVDEQKSADQPVNHAAGAKSRRIGWPLI